MLKAEISDMELWAAIRNNDEAAFTLLFDRYWMRLYKTACQYVDQEVGEGIVHDIFLNIWNRRHELQIATFPAFLLTAVRYQVYNYKRLAKVAVVLVPDYEHVDSELNWNEGESRIKERELRKEINDHMDQLPRRCQEIFQMSRKDDMSNKEIASLLGISRRTVENQITKALKHLRDQLGPIF